MVKYEIRFLEPAKDFLDNLGEKPREKIVFNIWKSREINDPGSFKKLTGEIWEFRTEFNNVQYRLLAFWDKQGNQMTLVIATHGFIKKTRKTPKKEIKRAEQLRKNYIDNLKNK